MPKRELCDLRPMQESDLRTILEWRNRDDIRCNMYNDQIIGWEEHAAWFKRVSHEKKSLHFVFEYDLVPRGVINITEIDEKNRKCHWGFYIGDRSAPRGSGTAMGFLALEHLFETLEFHRVVGEAFANNETSLRFHERLGFVEEGRLEEHTRRGETYLDVITLAILEATWQKIKQNLEKNIFDRDAIYAGHKN